MVGLAAAEQLAHHLESYLRELREGTIVLSKPGFEALVPAFRCSKSVINARRNDQPIPSIDNAVERLQAVSADSTANKSETTSRKDQNPKRQIAFTRWLVEFTPTAELAERGVNVNSVRSRLQEIGQ